MVTVMYRRKFGSLCRGERIRALTVPVLIRRRPIGSTMHPVMIAGDSLCPSSVSKGWLPSETRAVACDNSPGVRSCCQEGRCRFVFKSFSRSGCDSCLNRSRLRSKFVRPVACACPLIGRAQAQFLGQKRAIFRKVKEIKGLRGGVHRYVAQAIPQIDAEIAKKGRLWPETSQGDTARPWGVGPDFQCPSVVLHLFSVSSFGSHLFNIHFIPH